METTLLASMFNAGLDGRLAAMVMLQGPLVVALVGGDRRAQWEQARLFTQLAVGEASERVVSGTHPDVVIFGTDDSHAVDRIRTMTTQFGFMPYEGARTVCVFLDAGLFDEAASNALLKTLEEGSQYLIIILCVNSRDDLLETIQSRARFVQFGFAEEDMVPFPNALLSAMRAGTVYQLDVTSEDVHLALEQMERGLYAWSRVKEYDEPPDWMVGLNGATAVRMMGLLLRGLWDFEVGLHPSLVACALQVGMGRKMR